MRRSFKRRGPSGGEGVRDSRLTVPSCSLSHTTKCRKLPCMEEVPGIGRPQALFSTRVPFWRWPKIPR